MKFLGILKRLKLAFRRDNYSITFAQCGEDRIVMYLFQILGVTRPNYLDIGANHPTNLSNTYLLYTEGSRGVCIEPNPVLYGPFLAKRPYDTCLNIGIGKENRQLLDFYVFDNPNLSTFSKSTKEEQLAVGHVLQETRAVEVRSINSVIEQYFPRGVDFISLDTEGLDFEILQALDFKTYRPTVVCVETLTYVEQRKTTEIIDYMLSCGYVVYADTNLNTIFVDETKWANSLSRRQP